MQNDILIAQEESRHEGTQIVLEIERFIKDSDEVNSNDTRYEFYIIMASINCALLELLVIRFMMKGNAKVVTALAFPQYVGLILLAVSCYWLANCHIKAISKEYSQYRLLVYLLLTTEKEIRKIKLSKNQNRIMIFYWLNIVIVENDVFEIQGNGKNVYFIDLDDKCIYSD